MGLVALLGSICSFNCFSLRCLLCVTLTLPLFSHLLRLGEGVVESMRIHMGIHYEGIVLIVEELNGSIRSSSFTWANEKDRRWRRRRTHPHQWTPLTRIEQDVLDFHNTSFQFQQLSEEDLLLETNHKIPKSSMKRKLKVCVYACSVVILPNDMHWRTISQPLVTSLIIVCIKK